MARSGIVQVLCALALHALCTMAMGQEADSTAAMRPPSEVLVASLESEFNTRVLVVDRGGFRSLRFGSVDAEDQTRIRPGHPDELPMPYLRTAALGLGAVAQLRRVLMVGLGGGAFANYLQAKYPQVAVDAVEIDPVVVEVAREYFELVPGEQLRVHVMDAVDFVHGRRGSYDYILLDAYDADDLPEALLEERFLLDVKARLAPGGVTVANVAISGYYETRRVIRRFQRHYAHCVRLTSLPSYNDVLLLSEEPLPSARALSRLARRMETGPGTAASLARQIETLRPCL